MLNPHNSLPEAVSTDCTVNKYTHTHTTSFRSPHALGPRAVFIAPFNEKRFYHHNNGVTESQRAVKVNHSATASLYMKIWEAGVFF